MQLKVLFTITCELCHLTKHELQEPARIRSVTRVALNHFGPTSIVFSQSKTVLISAFFDKSDSKRAAISGQELRG